MSSDRNKFVCFFLYSVFLLFFLSPDSYLYDVFFRCDSAWFFTCGKAWMNGMVPYVDFADSKGPLLWLIYGIGYLLNSHSYVGVFWVSCVFYAVSFTFAYKISRLYLDRKGAALVLALLPAFLFYKSIHYEVRAEDYCNTFLFISLYCLCRGQKGVDKRHLFKYAFILGACMTCCLLIKWSIFLMFGGIALAVLFISLRNKTVYGLWGGLAGIVAPAIPFLVYFAIQGNFDAFVSEYFLNTASTVHSASDDFWRILLHGFVSDLRKFRILIFTGVLLFAYRYKGNFGILFSLLTFYFMLSVRAMPYYYYIIFPFGIFLLISIVGFLESKVAFSKRKTIALSAASIIGITALSMHYSRLLSGSVFETSNKYRQSYYDVSQLMATVKKPKIMFYKYDLGVGVLADALPACKYWAQQNGATPEMRRNRREATFHRKADFLIISNLYWGNYDFTPSDLNHVGYVHYRNCVGEGTGEILSVYCKKELYRKLPPVKIRTIDLLLKRDILSGNSETK